ncbi:MULTISPECIES: hypothetical protein [unclassified Ruegeria]|uniref:hypothetical protein n=1 Tax=unclassified Ruegeria TaxID=2625375 RepID=UPI001ADAABA9|nr:MULTISPECIES: hypothetical protein [unclassified Ruegeria]MBO9411756.1 hypothetical protein [Ruegeria sp. R8_1]MBO9415683.1 hypothetical protein [Ruegeria sp. R8_2]
MQAFLLNRALLDALKRFFDDPDPALALLSEFADDAVMDVIPINHGHICLPFLDGMRKYCAELWAIFQDFLQ